MASLAVSARRAFGLLAAVVKTAGVAFRVAWTRFLYVFFPDVQKRIILGRKHLRPDIMHKQMEEDPGWGRGFLGSTELVKDRFKVFVADVFKDVEASSRVPDIGLIDLITKEERSLRQLMRGTRPLVLNFGSCT